MARNRFNLIGDSTEGTISNHSKKEEVRRKRPPKPKYKEKEYAGKKSRPGENRNFVGFQAA